MTTKLTLSMDPDIIRKAKIYARQQNRSLSNLIESYLRSLIEEGGLSDFHLNRDLASLRGAFKETNRFDMGSALTEKYLKND